jgi:hypothetical protein
VRVLDLSALTPTTHPRRRIIHPCFIVICCCIIVVISVNDCTSGGRMRW